MRHLYGISRSDWTAATGLYTPDPSIFNNEAHLESVDVNSGRRRIPVYELVSTGLGSRGGVIVSHVDIPPEFVGEHSAYRISGDSMIPDIKDSATVIVRVREYASAGNIIVGWTPEEGRLCKYLSRIYDGYFVLESLNSSHRPG